MYINNCEEFICQSSTDSKQFDVEILNMVCIHACLLVIGESSNAKVKIKSFH